jgi:magnesium chelatase family protein
MSLAIVNSRANLGMSSPAVTIEVHLSPGLPGMNIVGLPEKAVKESKDRVRIAIMNNGFTFPVCRVVVNLAPADLPKEGGRFDLPIALGILAASDQIPKASLDQYEFVGELALTGELKSVIGVLPMALATAQAKRAIIIPLENAQEASLCDVPIYGATHLKWVCAHLAKKESLPLFLKNACNVTSVQSYPDLADVRGQFYAKRALEIAAAGGHSLLFSGPPGTGKTMLSSRLPGMLPSMPDDEAQSPAVVHSISARGFDASAWRIRPFRAPHHTASSVALVGGGSPPKPGEISLAHNGVLFLDELPEFDRHVLEALREPLEAGCVTISRAGRQAQFPSRFQFIAAMNPCPCGYYGDTSSGRCKCSMDQILRYQNKISGPLLDRIDMHVTVSQLSPALLLAQSTEKSESSDVVRERVLCAREKQMQRSQCTNAQLTGGAVTTHCRVDKKDHEFLEKAMMKLGLSARAFHRILKLSRTIADLDNSDLILQKHLQEALGYRRVTV